MHLSDFKTWDKTKFFSQHYAKKLTRENSGFVWSDVIKVLIVALFWSALLHWSLTGNVSLPFKETEAKKAIN